MSAVSACHKQKYVKSVSVYVVYYLLTVHGFTGGVPVEVESRPLDL